MSPKKTDFQYTEFTISERHEVLPRTFLFRFHGHIPFKPGQFVQVASDHFGEATFAICSDPREKNYFELCIRGCGNTTNALVNLLPGDKMKIRGPYGNGWPIHDLYWKDVILIAGGLGLVPLRPLIYELLRDRINFEKIYLITGIKTTDQILFGEDLNLWRKKFDVRLSAEYITTNDFWGEKGMPTEMIKKEKLRPGKSVVFMCGPEVMVPFCNNELYAKGIKDKQIYISYERRMECGVGICQHCNVGKYLVCKDGPVFRFDRIKDEVGK